MPSDKYVFISYSRQDIKFVEELSKRLQKAGVSIWRDVEQIHPGDNWLLSIQNALDDSSAYLYILSKNSTKSEWVLFEHSIAANQNKKIIPILIDDSKDIFSDIPAPLKNRQWIDLSKDYDKNFKKLLNSLSDYTKEENIKENVEPKTEGYVFVSYSTINIDFVTDLMDWLKTQKFGYFDYHSSKRNYHTLFFLELEEQIKASKAVLSILSPEWKQSKWAVREFLFAEEINKPIFLLHHKKMPPCLLTVGLPYIDFTENREAAFQELEREMRDKGL